MVPNVEHPLCTIPKHLLVHHRYICLTHLVVSNLMANNENWMLAQDQSAANRARSSLQKPNINKLIFHIRFQFDEMENGREEYACIMYMNEYGCV